MSSVRKLSKSFEARSNSISDNQRNLWLDKGESHRKDDEKAINPFRFYNPKRISTTPSANARKDSETTGLPQSDSTNVSHFGSMVEQNNISMANLSPNMMASAQSVPAWNTQRSYNSQRSQSETKSQTIIQTDSCVSSPPKPSPTTTSTLQQSQHSLQYSSQSFHPSQTSTQIFSQELSNSNNQKSSYHQSPRDEIIQQNNNYYHDPIMNSQINQQQMNHNPAQQIISPQSQSPMSPSIQNIRPSAEPLISPRSQPLTQPHSKFLIRSIDQNNNEESIRRLGSIQGSHDMKPSPRESLNYRNEGRIIPAPHTIEEHGEYSPAPHHTPASTAAAVIGSPLFTSNYSVRSEEGTKSCVSPSSPSKPYTDRQNIESIPRLDTNCPYNSAEVEARNLELSVAPPIKSLTAALHALFVFLDHYLPASANQRCEEFQQTIAQELLFVERYFESSSSSDLNSMRKRGKENAVPTVEVKENPIQPVALKDIQELAHLRGNLIRNITPVKERVIESDQRSPFVSLGLLADRRKELEGTPEPILEAAPFIPRSSRNAPIPSLQEECLPEQCIRDLSPILREEMSNLSNRLSKIESCSLKEEAIRNSTSRHDSRGSPRPPHKSLIRTPISSPKENPGLPSPSLEAAPLIKDISIHRSASTPSTARISPRAGRISPRAGSGNAVVLAPVPVISAEPTNIKETWGSKQRPTTTNDIMSPQIPALSRLKQDDRLPSKERPSRPGKDNRRAYHASECLSHDRKSTITAHDRWGIPSSPRNDDTDEPEFPQTNGTAPSHKGSYPKSFGSSNTRDRGVLTDPPSDDYTKHRKNSHHMEENDRDRARRKKMNTTDDGHRSGGQDDTSEASWSRRDLAAASPLRKWEERNQNIKNEETQTMRYESPSSKIRSQSIPIREDSYTNLRARTLSPHLDRISRTSSLNSKEKVNYRWRTPDTRDDRHFPISSCDSNRSRDASREIEYRIPHTNKREFSLERKMERWKHDEPRFGIMEDTDEYTYGVKLNDTRSKLDDRSSLHWKNSKLQISKRNDNHGSSSDIDQSSDEKDFIYDRKSRIREYENRQHSDDHSISGVPSAPDLKSPRDNCNENHEIGYMRGRQKSEEERTLRDSSTERDPVKERRRLRPDNRKESQCDNEYQMSESDLRKNDQLQHRISHRISRTDSKYNNVSHSSKKDRRDMDYERHQRMSSNIGIETDTQQDSTRPSTTQDRTSIQAAYKDRINREFDPQRRWRNENDKPQNVNKGLITESKDRRDREYDQQRRWLNENDRPQSVDKGFITESKDRRDREYDQQRRWLNENDRPQNVDKRYSSSRDIRDNRNRTQSQNLLNREGMDTSHLNSDRRQREFNDCEPIQPNSRLNQQLYSVSEDHLENDRRQREFNDCEPTHTNNRLNHQLSTLSEDRLENDRRQREFNDCEPTHTNNRLNRQLSTLSEDRLENDRRQREFNDCEPTHTNNRLNHQLSTLSEDRLYGAKSIDNHPSTLSNIKEEIQRKNMKDIRLNDERNNNIREELRWKDKNMDERNYKNVDERERYSNSYKSQKVNSSTNNYTFGVAGGTAFTGSSLGGGYIPEPAPLAKVLGSPIDNRDPRDILSGNLSFIDSPEMSSSLPSYKVGNKILEASPLVFHLMQN